MKKTNLKHARTCVYNINYHIVWSVKYRRKIITPEVESYMRELISQIAEDKGFEVAEFESGEGIMYTCLFRRRRSFPHR